MVLSIVNVFLKHSTSFPIPHSRILLLTNCTTAFFLWRFTDQLSSHSLLLLLLLFGISHWWTFPPLPFLGTLLIGTLSPFPPFYLLIGPCWWSPPSTGLLLGEDHLSIHAPQPIPTIYGDTVLENSPNLFLWTDSIATFLHMYYFGVNPLLNFAPSPFFIMEWVL